MKRKPESKIKNKPPGSVQKTKHQEANVTSTEPIDHKILDTFEFPLSSGAPFFLREKHTEAALTKPSHFLKSIANDVIDFPIFLKGSRPTISTEPWDSPLCTICNELKLQGVPDENLIVATFCHSAMNSPHLGYPLVAEIAEEGDAGGVRIFNAAINLTPNQHIIEFPRIDFEILTRDRDELPGKTILAFSTDGFKGEEEMLSRFLTRQYLPVEETIQTKYGPVHQKLEVKGPTGFIFLNKDSKDVLLRHSSFIRLHLKSDSGESSFSERMPGMEIDWQRIKASLERLHHRPVKIPFAEQIRTHFNALKVKHPQEKLETFFRILSYISILNDPAPLSKTEICARVLGLDTRDLPSELRPDPLPPELVAHKVDYYYALCLLDNQLPSGDESLNPRLVRVFNAIKHYNLGYLKDKTTAEKEPVKAFLSIFNAKKAWPSQEKILETLSQDGGELPSMPTLYRDLKELLTGDLIREEKDSAAKNKNIYAVNVFSVGENIKFPHPSQIEDPVFNKRPVEVVNPFTGEVEMI